MHQIVYVTCAVYRLLTEYLAASWAGETVATPDVITTRFYA